jgi:orotidine-5'-phosphate decarboxylase
VALDVADAAEVRALVGRLGPGLDFVKVGLELYTREGPQVVRMLREAGLRVFLDLKLHDIPNTVAGAVRSAGALDVELLTLHASGGHRMLAAAAEAAPASGGLRLLAVTVLTSLGAGEVAEAWGRPDGSVDPEEETLRLARLAQGAGVHGVVSSPREARTLREALGSDALIVTPGIRFADGETHDQTRVATPAAAARAGASHLVLGRAVTAAPDPAAALARAVAEVEEAVATPASAGAPARGGAK